MSSTRAPEPGPVDPGVEVAASVTSLARAVAVFIRFGSPRVLVVGVALAVVARVGMSGSWPAPFTVWDLGALLVVGLLVPFVEWFVHRFVLHVEPRRLGRFLLDPGVGHREHHANPASVSWVLLRAIDAALFLAVNAGVAVLVIGVPFWLLGGPVLGPALTGVVAAAMALTHYEWSHFLFHTAYRPRTSRYRRLKANHRRHHWRDDRAWLGITSNLADRVLGTMAPPAKR